VTELSSEEIINNGPPIILCGTTEQVPIMQEVALNADFPQEKIIVIDCGKAGTVNTKTQFTMMNEFFAEKNIDHATFVTSDYHVPRTERTGHGSLESEINFDVLSVPHDKNPYNIFKVVRGEVKRIVAYSEKGDITKNIP
jgi:hypothetical protein